MSRPRAIARPGPASASRKAIHEDTDISGINVGLLLDIPGRLARGNWTAALYVDERASIYAVKALTRIFTGKAGGSTGLLKILVGSFLGVRTEKIIYEIKDGDAHLPDPEDHRRRGEADRRQGQAARTSSSAIPATGSAATSRSRAPRPRGCAPSAATGISPGARPSSCGSTGAAMRDPEAKAARRSRTRWRSGCTSSRRRAPRSRCSRCWPRSSATGRDVLLLGAALFVDGVDGMIARRLESRRACRAGRATCSILWWISSLTCSFRPSWWWRAGCCRPALAIPCAVAIIISGALYFADREMKTDGELFSRLPGGMERAGILSVAAQARSVDRGVSRSRCLPPRRSCRFRSCIRSGLRGCACLPWLCSSSGRCSPSSP